MEERDLQDLESRCVQDEPPACQTSCPFHVDVRTFVRQISQSQWDAAWHTLAETMPFPGILGRICDHPCEAPCKRGEAGDPIAIGALERACVSRVSGSASSDRLPPRRAQQVAVIGGGLSSLVASLDLLRKGYSVTIMTREKRLGGGLWRLGENVLPGRVIEEQIEELRTLGAHVIVCSEPGKERLEGIIGEFDAVYVGCDDCQTTAVYIDLDERGPIKIDPITGQTSNSKVFAGGLAHAPESWLAHAFQGRRAAVSIDRLLQKVSLTSWRENQGPYRSRLFTNISGVAAEPVITMSNPHGGYTEEEAASEAKRCLQCECLECVKACPYLEHFGGHPLKYARDIRTFKSVSLWRKRANSLINSCALCGLCTVVCPHDFPMAEVCHQGRRNLQAQGKMPPSAYDFALQDMRFNNSDKFALARNEPGKDQSAYVFFPGCQLSASSPLYVKRLYAHLGAKLTGGVGLMLRCCGAPADWAQEQELFQGSLEELRSMWSEFGSAVAIVACSTCHEMFKTHVPEIKLVSLWSVLEQIGLPERKTHYAHGRAFAVQDPCTTRHEPEIHRSVRALLSRLGCQVEELPYSRESTKCCGYGGLVGNSNPPIARDMAMKRAGESHLDYVTYCAMCRDNIAASDKRIIHILDIVYNDSSGPDPAIRKGPGYSDRHENRSRLRNELLREIWQEKGGETEDYERIILRLSPEVRERMEQRRIMVEDVQKVIHYAEKTGRRFFDPRTLRWLAYFKPMRVTYWVEYNTVGDEFVVQNTYNHRMEIGEGLK